MRALRAAIAVLPLLAAACDRDAPPEPELNVLLVTVDTLRADHLSCYGYPRETSPRMDRLAREGVRFRDVIVPRGQTWPSIASLFTSLHPRQHGVRQNGYHLEAGTPTLTRALKQRGYATAAFVTNMIAARYPDFDHVERFRDGDRDAAALAAVIPWLREPHEQAFFLWVHLVGPHNPYEPQEEFASRFDTGYRGNVDGGAILYRAHSDRIRLQPGVLAHIISLYDGEISQVDERIGAILDELDALSLRERTLVVLTADHGEELYQHNRYFLHALSIYDSVLRVPLVLRLPGVLPAGAEIDGLVRTQDVAPTILALAGVAAPEGFEGRSLLPAIDGGGVPDTEIVYSELGPDIVSLRSRRWHYIYNPRGYSSPRTTPGDEGDRGDFQIETEELYDLAADPSEGTNVASRNPEVAARMRERAQEWLAQEPGFQPRTVAPELLEELRAMGYLE